MDGGMYYGGMDGGMYYGGMDGGMYGYDGECAPGCPYDWISDGMCDSECENVDCHYDGEDCGYGGGMYGPPPPGMYYGGMYYGGMYGYDGECAPGCPYDWISDGVCDSNCFNVHCNDDGGDCDGYGGG